MIHMSRRNLGGKNEMGWKSGIGRTLRKAAVGLFNFGSVLGSLLCEHTPLLYQRHVSSVEVKMRQI